MSSQQLLQEPGAEGECGLATLLQTEAVGTGELGHGPQLHGHDGESVGRQRRSGWRSDGVKMTKEEKRRRVLIIELVKLFVLV